MKRSNKVLLFLSISSLIISLTACSNKKQEVVEEPTRAKLVMSGNNGEIESNYFVYSFDIKNFIEKKNEYDIDIAQMGMLFSANISSLSQVVFEKTEDPVVDFSDKNSFYQHLELEDLESYKVLPSSDVDKDDVTFLQVAHKTYSTDETDYDVCFITLEDSGTSGGTWASDFDVGYDNESYYEKTGEHPEWTNKENHKGFDVTANRCLPLIKLYQQQHLNSGLKQLFYVFGHSRGGALANLVAAKLIDLDYDVVSYGFASPAVTTSENYNSTKYNNVYSLICYDDPITGLLRKEIGFNRYGKTIGFYLGDYAESYQSMFETELPNGNLNKLKAIFTNLASSREGIYEISEKFTVADKDVEDDDTAESFIASYISPLKGAVSNLKPFVKAIKTPNEDGTINAKVLTCPGFFTTLIGTLLDRYGFNFTGAIISYSSLYPYLNCLMTATNSKTSDLVSANFSYFYLCHFYPSYLSYLFDKQ